MKTTTTTTITTTTTTTTTTINIPPLHQNQPIFIPFSLKWWPIIIIFLQKTAHLHTITEIRGHYCTWNNFKNTPSVYQKCTSKPLSIPVHHFFREYPPDYRVQAFCSWSNSMNSYFACLALFCIFFYSFYRGHHGIPAADVQQDKWWKKAAVSQLEPRKGPSRHRGERNLFPHRQY